MLKNILTARLAQVKESGLYRRLHAVESAQDTTVVLDGQEVLLFSSNNYLGLANHPALKRAAQEAIERYGCGSGASRLISGSMDVHHRLEQRLASLKQTEAALVFPTGYHANIGVLSALMGPEDTILSDALNHASIIDGCRLSRANTNVYHHCDTAHLAELLTACPQSGQRLIVTDTVFSMDGDIAPLADIVALAQQYDAWVMVDEAHATGVFGPHGAGIVEELGLAQQIDIQMGTLGKALGCVGAYIAGSHELIDWLINRARSFIYTTGIPPAVAASALAALDIVESEPERREQLWDNTKFLSDGLLSLGYTLGDTRSQILPVIIGEAGQTMALAQAMLQHGVFAHGIRPPTVPEGTSRIRATPMATHTQAQLSRTLDAFAAAGKEVGIR
jgi:8-amino-7-oxononanoate synthase